jgi:hypothetical protein
MGQAFDVDINCRNTLLEYNWSQLNTSGFLLVCSPSQATPGTSGIIVRNNVSIDDGEKVAAFKLVPRVKDVIVENNAIINSFEEDRHFFKYWLPEWKSETTLDILFRNNIFSTPGRFIAAPAEFVEAKFENNSYTSAFEGMSLHEYDNIEVNYPAVKIEKGMVLPTDKESSFKPFDISKAGLLPTSSWLKERDESLKLSLNKRDYFETPLYLKDQSHASSLDA